MIEITPKRQAMYVRKAIATLLSHKDIKRNSHSELKQACEEALKTLGKWFHEKTSVSFTLWKFEDFPFTQILREIKFGESRNSKTAICAFLEGLNFVKLVNCNLQKVHNFIKSWIQNL